MFTLCPAVPLGVGGGEGVSVGGGYGVNTGFRDYIALISCQV